MKIRQGFVTNSSSSSFVVALKKESDEYMNKFIKSMYKDHLLNTLEELHEYLDQEYDYRPTDTDKERDTYLDEVYKKSVEAINNGYSIIETQSDHYDSYNTVSNMIDALVESGVAILINEIY